ncbi:MAG: RagB/SusD family nutrient uptake outer membrane protein [Bacteroidia bacterium]|nr:RagB/SusD family nutrient uptake outer membrane protein [Bacteroidia bacterium]
MKTIVRNMMKKSILLIKVTLTAIIVIAFSQSCTKLDETLYSEVTPDNFFKSEKEFVSALGAAYTQFGGYASGDMFSLQEVTTDEMAVPTRGSDWDDGGNWRKLHLHSWDYEVSATGGAWDFCFSGVNTANRLMYQFQSLVESGQVEQAAADAYISELETVRGFFYWQLIDMYGNVPLVTDFASGEAAPATKSRSEVYTFVVGDLETAVPKLSKAVDGTTYGRMNYYAGQMLLAKLYLNAAVYTGTAQWDKVITACDEIINSGKYSLESNYFTNFNVNNSGSKEFIFAIPYDQIFFQGFNIACQTLHYGSQYTYNLTQQPWNGFCTLEEFYKSYDATDLRRGDVGTITAPAGKRGNFLAGYQYTNGGVKVVDDGADAGDPDGKPLNFGNIGSTAGQINELGPQCWRQSGVRIGKWEFAVGSDPGNMSNDLAVFRYADVMLMKAEALWRKSNSPTDAAALALVNQIRKRAGLVDLTSLDGQLSFDMGSAAIAGGELFNEMGREMFAEHNRRQDLIRWGLWTSNSKWTLPFNNVGDVMKSDAYRSLFPINKSKLAANPNLVQNTGY